MPPKTLTETVSQWLPKIVNQSPALPVSESNPQTLFANSEYLGQILIVFRPDECGTLFVNAHHDESRGTRS